MRTGLAPRKGDEFYHITRYYGFYSATIDTAWLQQKMHQCKMRIQFCVSHNINIHTDIIYKTLKNKIPPPQKLYVNRCNEISKANLVYPLSTNKSLDNLLKQLKKTNPTIEYCGVVAESVN
jgi:hypothetical protein